MDDDGDDGTAQASAFKVEETGEFNDVFAEWGKRSRLGFAIVERLLK